MLVKRVVDACANCEVEEAKSPVWNHVGVVVALVDVPKVVAAVHGQLPERVRVPPRATEPPPEIPEVVLIVRAPEFVRRELPIVVVETSLPVESVPKSADVRLVK